MAQTWTYPFQSLVLFEDGRLVNEKVAAVPHKSVICFWLWKLQPIVGT